MNFRNFNFSFNSKETLILFILVIAITAFTFFLLGKLVCNINNQKHLKETRNDAIKRSRAVLGGQLAEQIAPFLPGFPCNAADVRFIGKPFDFIAFPGMAEGKPLEEILLIEVKTGSSKLSEREKEIRELCKKGKVRYLEYYFSAN